MLTRRFSSLTTISSSTSLKFFSSSVVPPPSPPPTPNISPQQQLEEEIESNDSSPTKKISSVLERLLQVSFSMSNESNNNNNNNKNNNNELFIDNNIDLESIFSQTHVRYHAIRLPFQRHLAAERLSRRKAERRRNNKRSSKGEQQQQQKIQDVEKEEENNLDNSNNATEMKELTNKNLNLNENQTLNSNNNFSLKSLIAATKDLREERFLEFLTNIVTKFSMSLQQQQQQKTNQDQNSQNQQQQQYDSLLVSALVRSWLKSQDSFGLSFPSSESIHSPLLPTLLFFAAASRDDQLYFDLRRRMEKERVRFSENNNSSSSSTSNGENCFGMNSSIPGWIAAVAVTLDSFRDVSVSPTSSSSAKDGNNNDESDSNENNNNNRNNNNKIVDIASQRLEHLIRDDRTFSVSAKEAVTKVLPCVLIMFSETGFQKRMLLLNNNKNNKKTTIKNAPSSFNYLTGTKNSPSCFILWREFTTRICGVNSSSLRNFVSSSSYEKMMNNASSSSKRTRTTTTPVKNIPPYFVAFLLRVTQQHSNRLASPNNLASNSNNNVFDNNSSNNIHNCVEFSIACFVKYLSQFPYLLNSLFIPENHNNNRRIGRGDNNNNNNTNQESTTSTSIKPRFALYVRLIHTLASAGCTSWVMETVLKDCLAASNIQNSTSKLLCNQVLQSFPVQMNLMMILPPSSSLTTTRTKSKELLLGGESRNSKSLKTFSLLEKNSDKFLLFGNNNNDNNNPHNLQKNNGEQQPVDLVTSPIHEGMWNTMVEACRVVSSNSPSIDDNEAITTTKEEEEEENGKKDKDKFHISPFLLESIAATKVRCACHQLIENPSEIFETVRFLLSKDKQQQQQQQQNNNLQFSWCRFSHVFPSLFFCFPFLNNNNDETNGSNNNTSSDSSSDSSSFVLLWRSTPKRIVTLNTLFCTLSGISTFTPSPFLQHQQEEISNKIQVAFASQIVVDFILEKLMKEIICVAFSSSSVTEKNSTKVEAEQDKKDQKEEEDKTENKKSNNNNKILLRNSQRISFFSEFLKTYWEASCNIALTTQDLNWLLKQYRRIISVFSGDLKKVALYISPVVISRSCELILLKKQQQQHPPQEENEEQKHQHQQQQFLSKLLRKILSQPSAVKRFSKRIKRDEMIQEALNMNNNYKNNNNNKDENSSQQQKNSFLDKNASLLLSSSRRTSDQTSKQFSYFEKKHLSTPWQIETSKKIHPSVAAAIEANVIQLSSSNNSNNSNNSSGKNFSPPSFLHDPYRFSRPDAIRKSANQLSWKIVSRNFESNKKKENENHQEQQQQQKRKQKRRDPVLRSNLNDVIDSFSAMQQQQHKRQERG